MTRTLSIDDFQAAIETINRAIEANCTAPFFRHMLEACRALPKDNRIDVAVYYDEPTDPHVFFTIRMEDDALVPVNVGDGKSSPDWTVSEDYLLDLARRPQKFIDHPEKLSLNWLIHRVNSATK